MSELTIQASGFVIQPLVDQRDGPCEIRWWYSRSFLTSDNIQVQWGTGTTGFWITTPCSIADGLIVVDLDTLLWTTDDANDTNPLSIFLSAAIFSTRGKLIQQLQIANKAQWVVPVSLAPTTTWADFSIYNQATALYYYNPNYLNAPQTIALIDNSFDQHPASDIELGTVLLTVPADAPAQPVVWGANDPLVRDAIKIQGVDVSDTPPSDTQGLFYNVTTNQYEPGNQNPGTGNVVSNEVSSVDSQIAIASGTGGKTIKFYEDDGLVRTTGGVPAPATVGTSDLDDEAVTYAKIQNVSAASRLLGRGSAGGAGDVEEISLGSGMTMTGTTLSATGTGGDVTAAANLTDEAVVVGDGGVKGVQSATPVTINPSTGLMTGATVDDPEAAQEIASKNYVDSAVAIVAGSIPLISGLASGGVVFWESAYTFRVSAATYFIQGLFYSSIEQTVTLDAADPTLDRIDVLILDTTGTLVKITGTAAAQPSEPDYDPTTQLKLTFVFVGAATTQPAGVSNEDIYLENAEWTTSTSGSGWNPASTNNPLSGTVCIEGTNVANNAYVQLQRASPTALDSFAILTMFIRSKATWGNNRVLRVQFFSSGVAVGTAITIASSYWGFNSSTTGVYQFVAIPMPQFVIAAGTQVNQLRITDVGGAIGMFIDNIVLQAVGTSIGPPAPSTGITQEQGDARYAQRANNLSDLNSASTARTNLGLGALATVTPGAGVATFLTTPSSANLAAALTDETGTGAAVFANSPALVTPDLGTPSAGTLTNATGLPISTGVSGLGANVATFLSTPSSANLAAALTDETGTGAAVFANSPALVTPDLGTPSAAVLTNATGLPLTTGVTGDLPLANLAQASAASKLLGRGDSGAGDYQEITLGTNLSMSGTTLNAAGGGGGTPGGSDTQVQYNNAGAFGGVTGATSDGASLTLTSPKIVTGLLDTNGNPFIAISPTASAVDSLTITNSAAGSPGTVDIATTGSDTNINLTLSPKGTGQTLSSKVIAVTSGGTPKVQMQTSGLANASASAIQWSNGSSSAGTIDLGLARNAAGILEINSGSSTVYRWLKKNGQVRLAAQFDKTNTTLADVTGTSVALLSGQTYAFEFEANYDADATGGQKWAIAYSSTTSAIEYHITSICDASGLLVITSRQTASAGSAGQAGCTAGRIRICGSLTTTGAGNLTVQFAQNAANGTSSVRTAGSFFNVWPTTN